MACEQWEMKVVGVKVDDVECVCGARNTIERYEMIRERILALRVEPQRAFARSLQSPQRLRIATGEQGHLMPLTNEFFRQIRNHPLGAPIELWRTALVQRRNLRNPHFPKPYHVSFRRFREAMIAKSSPPAPVSPFPARRRMPRSRSRTRKISWHTSYR